MMNGIVKVTDPVYKPYLDFAKSQESLRAIFKGELEVPLILSDTPDKNLTADEIDDYKEVLTEEAIALWLQYQKSSLVGEKNESSYLLFMARYEQLNSDGDKTFNEIFVFDSQKFAKLAQERLGEKGEPSKKKRKVDAKD